MPEYRRALYRIKDWESEYENNRTRELKKLEFVLVPNKHDGDGFRTLISKPRGTALFGAWVLILQVASKCEPRGSLVRSDGTPHTAETIARMTGGDEKLIRIALDVLALPEIGWIEDVSAKSGFEIPPSRSASAPDKQRAVRRVDRYLAPERGVITPKGKVTERPPQCQWCESVAPEGARGAPGIVAHHLIGYGTLVDDISVIFVCRSCHGFFESGKYTTAMVIERYGSEWIPQKIAGDSDDIAGDSGAYAGIEEKVEEQNGTEEKAQTPARESAPRSTVAPARRVLSICRTRPNVFPELFEAWWARWASIRGTNHLPQAAEAWDQCVSEANGPKVFDCTNSYLASLSDNRGYNPEKFLLEQAKDGFRARWPPARGPTVQRKTAAADQEAFERIRQEASGR